MSVDQATFDQMRRWKVELMEERNSLQIALKLMTDERNDAWRQALGEAIDIVKAQPYASDTKVGARQEWMRGQMLKQLQALLEKT